MWTFLLDPVTQGIFALFAVGALGYVSWDLYDEAQNPSPSGAFKRRRRAEPQPTFTPRPRAKTDACVETWRDAAGDLQGRVTRGPARNLRLDELSRSQCEAQIAYARDHDPSSVEILQAYVRQRFEPKRRYEPPRRDGEMTRGDALAELGLREGASEAEIHAAWRGLIKRHHPDHGGSHAKAARINAAKAALEG